MRIDRVDCSAGLHLTNPLRILQPLTHFNNDRCQWDLAKLSPNEYYHYITTGEYPAGMLPLWVK